LKFRKINETTINCIITQDDLKEHGINLDDLFDRKKNAVEFIRGVILKAANSVNLSMKNDYTSMRICTSGPLSESYHFPRSGCFRKDQGDDRQSGRREEGDSRQKQCG
jgi:hypothetical protein